MSKNVLLLLIKIPKGKLTTYKDLSLATGIHPRAVAMILKNNHDPKKYPCYKVVHADGRVGGYSEGVSVKIAKLRRDGIIIDKNRIENLEKVRFTFSFHRPARQEI